MTYTTADHVYDKVGITVNEIDATQMTRILEQSDAEVDRIMNTTSVPRKTIEIQDGEQLNYTHLRKLPLLSILKLEINETEISLSNLRFYPEGKIQLLPTAEQTYFYRNNLLRNVKIKFLWGWLEESLVNQETQSDATEGVDQTVSVEDGTKFTDGDYIKIAGFDGFEEVTKINSISTNDLNCDLIYDHETGSTVIKLEVPKVVSILAGAIAAIMSALYMIGQTYTFATSYQTPDYQVTKGVPYPHFQKNLDSWVAERDYLIKSLPKWPAFS